MSASVLLPNATQAAQSNSFATVAVVSQTAAPQVTDGPSSLALSSEPDASLSFASSSVTTSTTSSSSAGVTARGSTTSTVDLITTSTASSAPTSPPSVLLTITRSSSLVADESSIGATTLQSDKTATFSVDIDVPFFSTARVLAAATSSRTTRTVTVTVFTTICDENFASDTAPTSFGLVQNSGSSPSPTNTPTLLPPPQTTASSSSNASNAAVVAFSVLGCLAGAGVLIAMILFCLRRYKLRQRRIHGFKWMFTTGPERRSSFMGSEVSSTRSRNSHSRTPSMQSLRSRDGQNDMLDWVEEESISRRLDDPAVRARLANDLTGNDAEVDMVEAYSKPATWTDQRPQTQRPVRQPDPNFVLSSRHQLSFIPEEEESSRSSSHSNYSLPSDLFFASDQPRPP